MLRTIGLITAACLIFLYTLIVPPILVFAAIFGGLFGLMLLYGAFCAQLSAQAIIIIVQAKRTGMPVQRTIAVGLILALPLVLLLIAVPMFSQSGNPVLQLSSQRWNLLLLISFIAQVAGSVWMWVLIAKLQRRTEPIAQQSVAVIATPTPMMTEVTTSVPLTPPSNPPRKKIGLIVLLLSPVLFVASIVVSVAAKLLDPMLNASLGGVISTLGVVATSIGIISVLAFFPCLVAGIILIIKGR